MGASKLVLPASACCVVLLLLSPTATGTVIEFSNSDGLKAERSYFLELGLSGSGKNALLTRHCGQGSVRISRSAEREISVWPQSQHLYMAACGLAERGSKSDSWISESSKWARGREAPGKRGHPCVDPSSAPKTLYEANVSESVKMK